MRPKLLAALLCLPLLGGGTPGEGLQEGATPPQPGAHPGQSDTQPPR